MDTFLEVKRPCQDRLREVTKQHAKTRGITFTEAHLEICRDRPELWEAARREVCGLPPLSAPAVLAETDPVFPQPNNPHSKKLSDLAKARVAEKGITYSEALGEIRLEQPELAHLVRMETLGIKCEVKTLGNGMNMVVINSKSVLPASDPSRQLAERAHTRAIEKGVSYRMALSEVCHEDRAFAEAVRKHVTRGK